MYIYSLFKVLYLTISPFLRMLPLVTCDCRNKYAVHKCSISFSRLARANAQESVDSVACAQILTQK